ncbi:MAG: fatty acid desaturase, partial [Nostocales cyanobacterium]
MTTSLIKDQETFVYTNLSKDEIKLKHIIKSIPKECFQKNSRKAWTTAILSLSMAALGYYFLAVSPWFLL